VIPNRIGINFQMNQKKKDRQEIVRIMFLNKEKSLLFLPKLNTTPLHPYGYGTSGS